MTLLQPLRPYLRPFRRRIAVALGATLVIQCFALLPPLVYRRVVDDVVIAGEWDRLLPLLLVYAMLPIVHHLFSFANVLNIVGIGTRLVAALRLALYQLVLRLSMRYHGVTPTGVVLTRLMGDTAMVQQLVSVQTIQLLGDLLVFLCSVGVAFSIHPLLASSLLVVVALYAGAYAFFARRIRTATLSARTITDSLMSRLQETLDGVRHVRIYTREEDERQGLLDQTQAGLEQGFRGGLHNAGLGATCNAVAGYGSTLIYALAAWFVLGGELTLGDLIALNSYVWMAMHPALRLTAFAGQFSQIRVSLERILEILREKPDIVSAPNAPPLRATQGRVEFRDVWFSYAPDKPLFEGMNLDIAAGSTVALVGHTGCGKSTLTSLLMRLWDVQRGAICIDGVDIRSVRLNSLRAHFGVVLQSPVTFDATIAQNIAYGRPDAGRAEIEAAARAAELLEFSEGLPQGLDTVVGTYGVKLSLGERQRVSIARAILRNPLILVLDEATSSLDSESEALIQRALERAFRDRTSFVVAHRLSTIEDADRILVMDRGRIVEQGTHAELLRQPEGRYRALHEELRRRQRAGEVDT